MLSIHFKKNYLSKQIFRFIESVLTDEISSNPFNGGVQQAFIPNFYSHIQLLTNNTQIIDELYCLQITALPGLANVTTFSFMVNLRHGLKPRLSAESGTLTWPPSPMLKT